MTSNETVRFSATLQSWHGDKAAWTFLHVSGDAAETVSAHEAMRRLELGHRRGFGSVKVILRIGESEANTSVFPIKAGGWFLPVKKAIHRAEGLAEGEEVTVELELL